MQYTYMKMFIWVKKKPQFCRKCVWILFFNYHKKASKIYLICHSYHLHVILYEW